MSSQYLSNARKLSVVAVKLSNEQRVKIESIGKEIENAKNALAMAFRLIDRDVEAKTITPSVAKIRRVEVEVEVQDLIENLHSDIKAICPSFTANAREVVEAKASELAYNGVQGAGKVAGFMANFIRPLVQVGKQAYKEAIATANTEYEKPADSVSDIEFLESMGK
jgi:hypothetical protein